MQKLIVNCLYKFVECKCPYNFVYILYTYIHMYMILMYKFWKEIDNGKNNNNKQVTMRYRRLSHNITINVCFIQVFISNSDDDDDDVFFILRFPPKTQRNSNPESVRLWWPCCVVVQHFVLFTLYVQMCVVLCEILFTLLIKQHTKSA